jgi:hypothetical protein
VALALVVCASTFSEAQDLPVRRLEVIAAGGWLGGVELGATDANLRQGGSPPSSFRLFSANTRIEGAPTFTAAAGFMFSRRWGVEGGVVVSHPVLRSSVSADAEAAPAIAVSERIDQYIFEGQLVILLEEARLGQRTVPFATAGAGYLRQLHEGLTVIEEGHSFHVGGGVKHWLLARDRGLIRAAGVRADARLVLLAGGIAFGDGARPRGAVSAGIFVSF